MYISPLCFFAPSWIRKIVIVFSSWIASPCWPKSRGIKLNCNRCQRVNSKNLVRIHLYIAPLYELYCQMIKIFYDCMAFYYNQDCLYERFVKGCNNTSYHTCNYWIYFASPYLQLLGLFFFFRTHTLYDSSLY